MKKKLAVMVVLAVLLLCVLAVGAIAEPADTMTTEVKVTFIEAVYFAEQVSGGMDIDFGEQQLPPLGTDSFIVASGSDHTLRVCDRRTTAGNWSVNAVMTSMASGTESFEGYLHLYRPTLTAGLTPNLLGTAPDQYIYITPTIRNVVTANSGLAQGNYEMKCAAADTQLRISVSQATDVKPLAYTSTVTWTLVLGP